MARVENDVLELVLDAVELSNDVVVAVVEADERDDLSLRLFEPGVGLDVLQHRFSHRPRPVLDAFVAPHSVELLDHVVGDVETGPHYLVL